MNCLGKARCKGWEDDAFEFIYALWKEFIFWDRLANKITSGC